MQSPFALAETNQTISSPINLALIQGTAPIQVEKILANGVAYPITWTDATHWQMQVPLAARSNMVEFVAVDEEAQPVVGAKAGLTMGPPDQCKVRKGRSSSTKSCIDLRWQTPSSSSCTIPRSLKPLTFPAGRFAG